jgi:hypothetical protein
MKSIQFLFAALAAFCLVNCASTGSKPITQGDIDQIRTGQTTETDLVRMFGPPTTESADMRGQRSLDWDYAAGPGAQTYIPVVGPLLKGMKTNVQQLSVLLGPNGKVKHYTTNFDPVPRNPNLAPESPAAYGNVRRD